MPRLPHAFRPVALLLAVAVLGLPARAEDEAPPAPKNEAASAPQLAFTDLSAKTQKVLAAAAGAYFDPEVEFLWRPRKDFVAALKALEADPGANALADIPLLRAIVYQGRHFNERFSDKKWQRDNEITDFKKTDGLYLNLKSERNRFTYTLPGSYPKDRAFDKIPRPDPYPVLLSIHEEIDGKDARQRAAKYPGGAVLKRRYPKEEFEALYDDWLVIAPVAARAKFVEDGAIRHRFLTAVLTNFWRRYHVDFDRIVVDGAAPAAALAAAFPHVFAGLVLRPGKDMSFEPEVVPNYATVPVFVVDDKDLGKQLEDAGHPDVTIGSDKEVVAWMNERRRVIPKSFHWTMLRPDHAYANWVTITGPDYAAPERVLDVQVVDTESDPNTIRIDARGIEQVMMFLSDEIVDLGREVRVVVNGEEKKYVKIERDFSRLFELDPKVRENMNFGWLFPVLLTDIKVPEPQAEEKPPEDTPEPASEGSKGSAEDEQKAAELWAKAEAAEQAENMVKARLYYGKIVDLGETSYLARASAKLEELK